MKGYGNYQPGVVPLLAAGLLAGLSPEAGAVSILFGGDFFPDSVGAGIPDGAIVQLVVSTEDASFGDPTIDSFVGEADDLILMTTTADSFLGTFNRGVASGFVQNRNFDTAFDSGDPLLLRWWPTLTAADSEPGATVVYGEFRPADDSTVTAGSDHPFLVPDNQSDNITLRMNVDFAGDQTNPSGDVALGDIRFGQTPVPEAGVGLLVLLGGCGLALRRRRG